jgi:hypothetical protein
MKENAQDWAKTYGAKFLEQGVCKYEDETILIKNDAIFKMMESFKGRPVVVLHQDVTPENFRDKADGYVCTVNYNEYDGAFHCGFVVFGEEANQKIQDGWSVSCAYIPTEWGEGGEWHNIPYDREILNGEFTHLAIVDAPRYEDIKIYENSKKKEKTLMFKLFQKKEVENAKELLNSVIEIDGKDVSLNELAENYKNLKKNEKDDDDKEKVNMDDEIDIDGETVKVKELVDVYKEACKENEDDDKDSDDDKKDSKKSSKKNSDDDEDEDDEDKKKKEDKENSKKHFKKLENAHQKSEELQNSNNPSYDSQFDQAKRGQLRYGTLQRPQ